MHAIPATEGVDKQRWGRDSNPRYAEAYTGFQDRRIQPLCHPTSWPAWYRLLGSRLMFFRDVSGSNPSVLDPCGMTHAACESPSNAPI